jgi:hypothetical protein
MEAFWEQERKTGKIRDLLELHLYTTHLYALTNYVHGESKLNALCESPEQMETFYDEDLLFIQGELKLFQEHLRAEYESMQDYLMVLELEIKAARERKC